MRICTRCQLEKADDEFYEVATRQTAETRCKVCSREVARGNWDKKSVDEKAAINRERALKRRYGMTIEAYEAQLTAQDGVCAICSNPPKGGPRSKRLHVDHNHITGKNRGLLCVGCNSALGYIEHGLFDEFMEYIKNDGVM